ncbi:hypothetical protein MNBD_UNCLBAC01-3 [hydrothermal vent metagenome]|uniref:Uncharacterized protein n=1 Tax=hydrothermal vent metagenome TaxID=652676 RepID=A0A3B1DJX5_9ZZZZ
MKKRKSYVMKYIDELQKGIEVSDDAGINVVKRSPTEKRIPTRVNTANDIIKIILEPKKILTIVSYKGKISG